MKVYQNFTQLVGKTPLLELTGYESEKKCNATILAKLEYFNPAGSVKDRIAVAMIKDAEEKGLLKPGSVIIEPTSGNTGIGLAAVAASRGYRTILTMPETMSVERRTMLAAYGAELILTEGDKGMRGAIEKARELADSIPHSFIPGQFTNEANPRVHYETTGPEIWKDADGRVDVFVAGVGTGGTLSGVGKYLKEKNPKTRVIAVEPEDSPVLSKGRAGSHKLQGLGAGFIPYTLDMEIFDEVIAVGTEDAYKAARTVAHTDGILPGISSGAALHAAWVLAKRPENRKKKIVVLFPDGGSRYLFSPIYSENRGKNNE
ncbi:MAG: cysteine synthase A [Lachnospiraceae bacterium]|nr:cysteine synthase A [Lachnospiraceae bacterium]